MSLLDENLEAVLKTYGEEGINAEDVLNGRHPSSVHMLRVLAPNPNLTKELYNLSVHVFDTGFSMYTKLPDGPELTAGMRKLLEAKDCFVRAMIDQNPVDYRDR